MTVGVAVRALDGSAVIAADAMTFDEAGTDWRLGCKLQRHQRGVYFAFWRPGRYTYFPAADAFADHGWGLWGCLELACADRDGALPSAHPGLYFAGRDDAGHVALMTWTATGLGQWAQPGTVLFGGLLTCSEAGIELEQPEPPATAADARRVAAGLVAEYIRRWFARDGMHSLDDYRKDGRWWPPVAPPVAVATVTDNLITVETDTWEPH